MGQRVHFGLGNAPRSSDGKWNLLAKWLNRIQTAATTPQDRNWPHVTDSKRGLLVKIVRAIGT